MRDSLDWKVLKRVRHVEHMSDMLLSKRVYKLETYGRKDRARLCVRCSAGVEKVCNASY